MARPVVAYDLRAEGGPPGRVLVRVPRMPRYCQCQAPPCRPGLRRARERPPSRPGHRRREHQAGEPIEEEGALSPGAPRRVERPHVLPYEALCRPEDARVQPEPCRAGMAVVAVPGGSVAG